MAKEEQIKTSIDITGEREYRNACKAINSSLREIGSEMKLITAEFAGNADSTEALTKKQEVLQKSLDEQAKKAAAAEAALEKMRAAAVDPTSTAFQKMQTNLNNTKAEMVKTQAEIDGITASLNKTTPASEQFAAEAANVDKQLGLLASEMKVVSAEYENNGDSAQALKAKQEVLKQVFAEQQKKVEALEKAYRSATVEYGENSDEALELKRSLNECTAEMKSTKNQIDKIDDSLKKSKISWESVGSAVATGAKAFAVGLATIAAAAGAVAYKLGTAVVESFGDYEQLVGGVETLFGSGGKSLEEYAKSVGKSVDEARAEYDKLISAQETTLSNADNAFRTAGLSANDYMETVTSFSAALVSGLGGDTEKAAKLADLAITDMSDNANKMGTDISAIQNAYQGFAKQNYTMLDNLKLGYGGTQSEMIRLINDSGILEEKITSLDNVSFDQMILAIHEIQDQMGVTGTTAEEATKTIQGSMNSLSAAWSNLITGLGNADADIQKLVDDVAEYLGYVIDNITPVVQNIVKALPTLLNGVAENVGKLLPTILTAVVDLFKSILSTLLSLIPELISVIVEAVMTVVDTLIENLPLLVEAAAQLILELATGIAKALPTLVPTAVDVIMKIVQTLIDNIPLLIDAALQLITGLAQGIINAIPVIVAALPQVISSLIDGLLSAIPQIIQAGIDLLTALVTALPEIIAAIVEAIPQIIDGIITALTENIPLIIQAGIDLLVALIQALPEIIVTIVQAIPQIISSIVNALIGNIDQIIMAGVQLFVALIQNLPTIIVEIVKAVPQIVSGIVQAFASLGGEMINAGANLLHGLWEGISGAASWLWEKVSGWASSLVSGIKDFFGIHSPSTVFAEIGGNMADGVGVGFTDNMGGVEGDMTAAMGGAGALTAAEAVNAVNNGIIANIEGLSGAVNAIVERVITGLTAQAQRFNQAGQDFDKNIASGMVTAIVQITQKIPQIVQSIITAFTAQHQKFVTEGTNIDKSIAQGMIAGIPQITGKVAQIIQPIITALRSYVSEFTAAGEEMVRGIWRGFQNMSGWLESKVRSMMREIVAAVEAEMQINSPSKVFARIGSYMAQGLGEGFAREMRDVESTIRRETSNAVPEFRSEEGRDKRGGSTPSVEVVQNIYANETSYAEQQRQAARQFRQIAREVMA